MGEHHEVDRLRINRQRLVVTFAEFLRTLKNAAIDEELFACSLHEIFRAGDRACRAKKSELCHRPAILDDIGEYLVSDRLLKRVAAPNPYNIGAIAISRS